MNKQNKKWEIAKDLIGFLGYSQLWYLGIMTAIFILMFIFLGTIDAPISNFLTFSHGSTKVYMFIMGIIGAYYFIPMYVQMGVTRKQSVIGNGIGAIGGSLILVVFVSIIALVQHFIFQGLNIGVENGHSLFLTFMNFPEGIETTHFLLNETFIANVSRWMITLLSFWVSVLLDYAVGSMIGTGFYRSGVLGGVGTIIIGIIFMVISDIFWSDSVLPFMPDISLQGDPFTLWLIAMTVMLILLSLSFWIIRQLTKRIAIKY